jgi:hypothetical protein
MNPIEFQSVELCRVYGENADVRPLPGGASLITIPVVKLPSGWSKEVTTIRFIAPVGYPIAAPDCFWADADLRLEGGGEPQASNGQAIPEVNEPGRWFSWHVQNWNPNLNNLVTYAKIIEQRLREVR